MKRLIIAALAAVMAAGVIVPVQAAGLRKKEHHLQREIGHRRKVYLKKVTRWQRKHPHASPEAKSRFGNRINRQEAITERKERKANAIERHIVRKAHHRH